MLNDRILPRSSLDWVVTLIVSALAEIGVSPAVKKLFSLVLLASALCLLNGCRPSSSNAAAVAPPVPDEVAMREAALRFAFDRDSESSQDRSGWIFDLAIDARSAEVIARLGDYPIAHAPLQCEDRGTMSRVDVATGKRIVFWRIQIKAPGPDDALAEISCVKGGLNGYGLMLFLRKIDGRWVVRQLGGTWVS